MNSLTYKLIFISPLVYFLTACSGNVARPLYSQTKDVPIIPKVKESSQIKPQKTLRTNFNLVYPAKAVSADFESTYKKSSSEMQNKPTIVIALPVEKKTSQNKNPKNTFGKKQMEFKTEGYINKAEPNIEKALMHLRFSVIDRSKLEAQLRTLRDSSKLNNHYYATRSKIYEAKLKSLQKLRDNGDITHEEFYQRLSESDLDSQKRSEGDQEIVDMSELIRAAQSEGVGAQYILQLNKVEIESGYSEGLKLKGRSEVETYMQDNPDMQYGNYENNIPVSIPVDVYQAVFSAKLINVSTGKVEWVGTHELNSLNMLETTISFSVVRKDATTTKKNEEIIAQNSQMKQLYNTALQEQETLNRLYIKASNEREYEDEYSQITQERQLKSDIYSKEVLLDKTIKKIKKFNDKKETLDDFNYAYTVSEFILTPDLTIKDETITRRQYKEIKNHQEKLLNLTIRELLKTIGTPSS